MENKAILKKPCKILKGQQNKQKAADNNKNEEFNVVASEGEVLIIVSYEYMSLYFKS